MPSRPIRVKSTQEGLLGDETATGYVIDKIVSFCALPSENAKWMWVEITNPANGKSTIAQVLDVGPWDEHDDAYVFHGKRPRAESGIDEFGRVTNGSGIDLGYRVVADLGIAEGDNVDVIWKFVYASTLTTP